MLHPSQHCLFWPHENFSVHVNHLASLKQADAVQPLLVWGNHGVGKRSFAYWLCQTLYQQRPKNLSHGIISDTGFFHHTASQDCFILDKRPKSPLVADLETLDFFLGQHPINPDGWKFILLFDVHLWSPILLNKLLKSLEEVSEKTLFILTVSHPTAILPTITSRCMDIWLPNLSKKQSFEGISWIKHKLTDFKILQHHFTDKKTSVTLEKKLEKLFAGCLGNMLSWEYDLEKKDYLNKFFDYMENFQQKDPLYIQKSRAFFMKAPHHWHTLFSKYITHHLEEFSQNPLKTPSQIVWYQKLLEFIHSWRTKLEDMEKYHLNLDGFFNWTYLNLIQLMPVLNNSRFAQ